MRSILWSFFSQEQSYIVIKYMSGHYGVDPKGFKPCMRADRIAFCNLTDFSCVFVIWVRTGLGRRRVGGDELWWVWFGYFMGGWCIPHSA